MVAEDWRSRTHDVVAPLLEAERRRWLLSLSWDYASTITAIEDARARGQLPGYLVLEGDHIAGWSYHLEHRGTVQLGALVADSPAASACLIDATIGTAGSALAYGCFDAPDCERLFTERGCVVEPYGYLERAIADTDASAPELPHVPYDLLRSREMAQLCQRAYAASVTPRPFARHNSTDEWLEYLSQLTMAEGCGVFDGHGSVMVEQGGRVIGAAIVSRVSSVTSHLCQLVVDPDARERGLGGRVLQEVLRRAQHGGSTRLTLTVASSNAAACRLYARAGFTERAGFVLAIR